MKKPNRLSLEARNIVAEAMMHALAQTLPDGTYALEDLAEATIKSGMFFIAHSTGKLDPETNFQILAAMASELAECATNMQHETEAELNRLRRSSKTITAHILEGLRHAQ